MTLVLFFLIDADYYLIISDVNSSWVQTVELNSVIVIITEICFDLPGKNHN